MKTLPQKSLLDRKKKTYSGEKQMEISTPKEFFEKALPQRFKAQKAAGINVTVQVVISGPQGGNWTVAIKNQTLNTEEGITETPDLALNMTKNDFLDLVNNRISAERAFFSGKVHFKGNIALALKLRDAGFL
jgi:putative sterol carrier protein